MVARSAGSSRFGVGDVDFSVGVTIASGRHVLPTMASGEWLRLASAVLMPVQPLNSALEGSAAKNTL